MISSATYEARAIPCRIMGVPAYISDIYTCDATSSEVPDALDHLVDDLTCISFCAHHHLKPMHPALGILSGSTLQIGVRIGDSR